MEQFRSINRIDAVGPRFSCFVVVSFIAAVLVADRFGIDDMNFRYGFFQYFSDLEIGFADRAANL